MEKQVTKLIILAVIITALVAGSGVYFWQKSAFTYELQTQIEEIQKQHQKAIDGLKEQITRLLVQTETVGDEEEQPVVSETAMGYIKKVYEENGKRYLDIDYIQWLTDYKSGVGTTLTASKACVEDGNCSEWCVETIEKGLPCMPNGYYIRNQNPKIRTFEISNDVEVRMVSFGFGADINTYEEFKALFDDELDSRLGHLKNSPYHVVIEDEVVVKIIEQYIP